MTVVNSSPAEVARVLTDANLRLVWDPKLSESTQESKKALLTKYVGYQSTYQRSFNFEILPSDLK